jgi:hypothetical protein
VRKVFPEAGIVEGTFVLLEVCPGWRSAFEEIEGGAVRRGSPVTGAGKAQSVTHRPEG